MLGRFRPDIQEHRRARLRDLRQAYHADHTGTPLFVDARCRAEFDGHKHAYMPRMGRLPAAVLIPFADLFDGSDAYVTRERYLARLPVEVQGARALVTYCEVGVRASLVALLHEVYTGRMVAVFDGALMAWSLQVDLPVYSHRAPTGW